MLKMRFNMPKRTLKRMVWLLCISVALTACKEKAEIIEVVRPIKTMTVSEQAAEQIRKFSGLVAAVDSSDLSFQVAGQVASVEVDIGDHVKKEQVLAALDPEPYQLEVDAIKAELVKARDDVYLHDTPTYGLFKKEQRAFSHVCNRRGRPAEMAAWVLGGAEKGWSLARVNEVIAGGKRQVVVLDRPVPIYILYRTAYVNPEDNALYFYEDVYGRDKLLAKALFGAGG